MESSVRFWSMIRRRGWLVSLIATACSCGAVIFAYTVTPIYRSEGRLLIEQGEIPQELVMTTVGGYAEEWVELVRQRVMTNEHVANYIETHGLYATKPLGVNGRQRLFQDRTSALVETARDGTMSIRVSFDDESPDTARTVAESLVHQFVEENIRRRTESASDTAQFLQSEASRLATQIADYEQKIAEFKEANSGRLPQQVNLNTQALDRAEREQEGAEREIRTLEQRRAVLEADLLRAREVDTGIGNQPPPPGSAERLAYLKAEYVRLLSLYSPEHPDVRRLRREIELLSPGASGSDPTLIAEQIREQEAELAELRKTYSDDHPEVVAHQRALSRLRDELSATATAPPPAPQDPEIVRLTAEREGIERELAAQRARREELRQRIASYEARLDSTPQVERQLLELTRGYDQLRERYDRIKLDQSQVEMSVSAEEEQRNIKFVVAGAPGTPTSPVNPNRPAVIILGLFLGVATGLGLVMLLETVDKSLRDEIDLREAWHGPPLVTIPQIRNAIEARKHAWRMTAFASAIIVMVSSAAWTVVT